MIDFNKLSKDISQKRNKIKKNLEDIKKNNNSIELKSKSIKLEGVLNSFPSKGIGSIKFYNILNEKYDVYDNFQFNKIVRYIDFVENLERDYSRIVKKSINLYINDPNSNVYQELTNQYNFLSLNYQLLKVLTDEVDGDKLMYNKVYNELEDKGMFLTEVEKFNIETYKSINNNLKTVVNNLEELNVNINEMSSGIWDVSSHMSDINNSIWNIENKME